MSTTEIITQPEGQPDGMIAVAESRAAQEVQAAMTVAKRFPRDETAAFNRVLKACKRKTLAECAMYVYPRGGTQVTGPSIRLAEVLARSWGNVDFGIIELEQKHGESTMMAYAWDLETNTRNTKVFTVKHERHTKNGSYRLTDPRDIYEMTANQGARRMRSCILGIIPGDVVDAAIAECEKTMHGDNKEPLSDRVRKMVSAFAEFNVTQEMIEARLGHRIEAVIETELVQLRKMYSSIKDNMANVHDLFPPVESESSEDSKSKSESLADEMDDMLDGKKTKQKKSRKTKKSDESQKSAFELFKSDMEAAVDSESLAKVTAAALAESQAGGMSMDEWKELLALSNVLKKSFESEPAEAV